MHLVSGCPKGQSIQSYNDNHFNRITLKAFANLSPGFALKPWVKKRRMYPDATLKELRRGLRFSGRRPNPDLSGLRLQKYSDAFFPGLPKRNPGLKLANAFSVRVDRFATIPIGFAHFQLLEFLQANQVAPALSKNFDRCCLKRIHQKLITIKDRGPSEGWNAPRQPH